MQFDIWANFSWLAEAGCGWPIFCIATEVHDQIFTVEELLVSTA